MGRVCKLYYFYYSGSFVLFIGMAVFGMSTLGRHTGVCELGYCMDVDACVEREEVLAMGPERANARGCFVCEGTNVFWPAHRSTALNKWHPAEPCGSGSVSYPQGGRLGDSYRMCWSTPLEMTLRDLTSPVLWLLAIAYLLQALGCLVGAAGMRHFSSKYASDWRKLQRWETYVGVMVKLFPRVNRLLNVLVAAFAAAGFVLIFIVRVCEEAEDDFGRKLFFGDVSAFIGAVIGIFALTCVGGTAFRRAVPPETPFYTPRSRPDADASRATRFCVEPTCHYFSTIGP